MAIDWDREVLAPTMAVFGEDLPVLYTPRGAQPFMLADAVFDAQYQHTVLDGDGQPVTTIRPVLGVRLARFVGTLAPIPAQNDTVYVTSVAKAYIIKDVQPDGHGYAKLILMEAAPAP